MKYAIIIDAGSSGSRALVYAFQTDPAQPTKLPAIRQISNTKVKPGLSTHSGDTQDHLWRDHFQELIDSARQAIPINLHRETPIFLQATAGMRLLPTSKRSQLLENTCKTLSKHTEFIITPCEEHVQVIDGDTEGIYGWIALNYLTHKLDGDEDKDNDGDGDNSVSNRRKDLTPYGFMDMGGASTQLAFVPTREDQIEQHDDDMYKVTLRNNAGNDVDWSVFVSSWLGFGANEARNRQLDALVNALPTGVDYDKDGDGKMDLTDPCSPVGMKTDVKYKDQIFTVTGSGEYEGCLKTIYPLLLKHLPCESEPCLFNGVHAPSFDFSAEKFVGVSEYWYTANDVFKLSGDYNYKDFERATQEFCSTSWDVIEERFVNREYGENLTMDLLKTSCFKASWIVNVLHEGFGMPRLGLDDTVDNDKGEPQDDEPIFKSVNNVDGHELSWTLGKMVLYASSQIPSVDNNAGEVGIVPGSTILKLKQNQKDHSQVRPSNLDVEVSSHSVLVTFSMFSLMAFVFYYYVISKHGSFQKFWHRLRTNCKTEFTNRGDSDEWINLEEGRGRSLGHHMSSTDSLEGTLRTRSTMNLHELPSMRSVSVPNSPKINSSSSNGVSCVPSAGSLSAGAGNGNGNDFSFQPDQLKHSFTYSSFRDHTAKIGKFNPVNFKLGNGSNASLKSSNN